MARAVILWNEHPTEVVAGFHARKVAQILKEKYGHNVEVLKLPPDISGYGILRDESKPLEERLLYLAKEHGGSYGLTNYVARKWRTPVFNFHATPAKGMKKAEKRHPRAFRISRKLRRKSEGELEVMKICKNAFIVEVPARLSSIKRPVSNEELKAGLSAVAGKLKLKEKIKLIEALDATYHERVSKLHARGQKKFLHPIISEKIAAEIHARLTEGKKK